MYILEKNLFFKESITCVHAHTQISEIIRNLYLVPDSAAYFNICATADFICATICPSFTEIGKKISLIFR